MARETDYSANATEALTKAGVKVAAEATKAGEGVATETADRIENASKGYGATMGAALKAVQDYNTKLLQVFQINAAANLRLRQTLSQTRSPTDFVEAMRQSLRERTELIVGQTKELAALGQEATRRAIEAVARGR